MMRPVAWKSAPMMKSAASAMLILLLAVNLPTAAAEEVIEIGPQEGVPAKCQPNDIDLDSTGRPWFTCTGADLPGKNDSVGVIDPSTKKVALYDVTGGCGPFMGAFDAQGRYWFSMRDCNKIGMIDPAAGPQVNEYPVDENATEPRGIAIDQSGKVWVALVTFPPAEPDFVGRFDPASKSWDIVKMKETGTRLVDVTVMKSGKVIVCDFQAGGIYRFDATTMAYGLVPVPTVFEPTWCRESPDGYLFVTSHGPNTYVMKIDVNDKYDNLTYPQVGLLPYAIAFDRDGHAWITEHLGNHIHRIAKDRTWGPRISLLTPQSYPFSIAIDQKNCDAWVGENNGNRIAYIPGSMLCPPKGFMIDTMLIGILAVVGIAVILVVVVILVMMNRKKPGPAAAGSKEEAKQKAKDTL